ncbi:hypothetical protein [Seonamhaeicola aphaedonensis]|nr:hypothetical protein [Seonamhaeicola aphaedonensis]
MDNDSISLKINDKVCFDSNPLMLANYDFPKLLCEIEANVLEKDNSFVIEIFNYKIKTDFSIRDSSSYESVNIKFIPNKNNIEKSYFIIKLRKYDIHKLSKIKYCSNLIDKRSNGLK